MASAQENIIANSAGNRYAGYMPGTGVEDDSDKGPAVDSSKQSTDKNVGKKNEAAAKAKEKPAKKDEFQKELEKKEKELLDDNLKILDESDR